MSEQEARSDAYRAAGVDIDAGNAFVDKIRPVVRSTRRSGVISDVGGFGGLFALDRDRYKEPVLVSGCDGVGTKLLLAIEMNMFDTIGIDLVAMCVNDILVHGAEPLFFLDYLATGALDPDAMVSVVEGIGEGCRQARVALLGGETAEMPGMYDDGHFDLSGFATGVIERDRLIDGSAVRVGSALIGLASSGVHSNGFSLVRKVIADAGADLHGPAEWTEQSLGQALLEPTKIYVRSVLHLLQEVDVLAAAHITGGGLIENLPRMLPKTARAAVDFDAWPKPAVFPYLQRLGGLPDIEMLRVFNCGIGFVLVVPEACADRAVELLEEQGERAFRIGVIEARPEGESQVVIRRGGDTLF
ncbi:MAG: phosphoribosylformylglycinamidine cyclo-ligase [Candidatus Dadabacteria bacterium]|nr:MAG: phosphoribosylformylglycinamidine cyclo-ligase [Candidatus Dadabacteria bacterium]